MAQCGNDKCPVVDKATCSRWWALSHTQESWLTRDQIMSLLLGQLASVLITGTVYIIQFYGFCCSMRIAQFEGGLDYRLTFFFSRAIPLLGEYLFKLLLVLTISSNWRSFDGAHE